MLALHDFDLLAAFLHNPASDGKTRREQHVSRSQVVKPYVGLANDFPDLVAWLLAKVDDAAAAGWLRDE
jgi:hypothetical protein